MADRVREQVLDYLLGGLDDSETETVQARLEVDPVYKRAMCRASSDMALFDRLRREIVPPPGLAKRTCEFLFDPARRLRAAAARDPEYRVPRRRSMTAPPATPPSGRRVNWGDMGVAAVIFVVAGLLVLPAIKGAHFFQAGVAASRNHANMADIPSADRPDQQIDNQGGVEQNTSFDDLHVEFFSTTRLGDGSDDIYLNNNQEVAPGLHRNDALIASSGTAPVVCVSLP